MNLTNTEQIKVNNDFQEHLFEFHNLNSRLEETIQKQRDKLFKTDVDLDRNSLLYKNVIAERFEIIYDCITDYFDATDRSSAVRLYLQEYNLKNTRADRIRKSLQSTSDSEAQSTSAEYFSWIHSGKFLEGVQRTLPMTSYSCWSKDIISSHLSFNWESSEML